jgi:hypothetical protein
MRYEIRLKLEAKFEECSAASFNADFFGSSLLTFRRNVQLPFSGLKA